uniref:Toll/interleukin-1 receptor domain-containing protein n=1 Tax=Streptomyces sp. NBC_00003 TaxID=2903608 RepID=A0AAU2V022_9ACTN
MGFRARSAKEMYRYAFRLDDRNSSLGDGFGWTILLLGDSGEVTREFLLRYGVELSAKTAHRVRFAFFSGLGEWEIDHFMHARGVDRHSARSFLDLLQAGLGRMPWRQRPLDWEGDGWRDLRPDAFDPFTGAQHVHSHLHDADQLIGRSIPDVDQAAWFAQKLGIGRHVPCLLMFTDLGTPQYHVLPFGGLSASEVYERVRGWVDTYYETNRQVLAHWSSVEERILSLSGQAHTSLWRIRQWPVQRRDDWLQLSLLAESARIARTDPEAALHEVGALTRNNRISRSFNRELYDLRSRVREVAMREEQAAVLTRIADRLRETSEPQRLASLLTSLARKKHPGLSAAAQEKARDATALFDGPWPASPGQELLRWWRRFGVPAVKWPAFSQFRSGWRELPGQESPDGDRRDHEAFWTALGECALSADAGQTADHALTRLADHYGLSPTAPAWTVASASLRRHLVNRVSRAQQTAPAWLLSLSPPVLLRECLFTGGRRDDGALREFLGTRPRLAAAVHELTDDPDRFAADTQQRLASWLRQRDAVVRAVSEDAHTTATQPTSRAELAQDIAATLEKMRAEFQSKVEQNAREQIARQAGIAHLAKNLDMATQLDSALRDYHDAVRSVVHPHMRDPRVITLTGTSTVAEIMGLEVTAGPPRAEQALHDSFAETRDDTREALSGHGQAQREGERWAPDARFAEVLTAVLPEPRAADVLAPFPGATPAEKASRAVRDQRVTDLLDSLSREELAGLLERARPSDAPPPRLRPGEPPTPAMVLSLFGLRVAPRVFISYAHEDDGGVHIGRVRTLWRLLRDLGIDARLDLPAGEEPQDWALWTDRQYRAADFVLVVASPAYRRRAEGTEEPGMGAGVGWEARLIRKEIYDRTDDWYRRILRVVLPGGSLDDLPDYLGGRTTTYYPVDPLTAEGAEKLVRYLTRQPYETIAPIGTVPHLPPRTPE